MGLAIALQAAVVVALLAMLINRAPVVYPQNIPFTPYGRLYVVKYGEHFA
jgi:hypothetical protein